MDRWIGRQKKEWKNGKVDRRRDRRVEERTKEWKKGRMDGKEDRKNYGQNRQKGMMDGQNEGTTDKWKDKR